MDTPLVFSHTYTSAIWGGCAIRSRFGRTDTPDVCAESWEISGHPAGMSVVNGGPFDGRTLASLVDEFGVDLVGAKAPDPHRFPLLIKLIDANRSLSVQVHPNETTAPITNGEPKTEAWVVLGAAPGAALYAGTAPGVTFEAFRDAAINGDAIVPTLARHDVREGDAFFIPGGVVHAIDAGCLIYEVQQSSDTTYRIYDWGRVGADGKPRQLHLDKALASVDKSMPQVRAVRAHDEVREGAVATWRTYVSSPFFTIRELTINSGMASIDLDGSTFMALFALDGGATVECKGGTVGISKGQSVLVPASAGAFRIAHATEATRMLVTTL